MPQAKQHRKPNEPKKRKQKSWIGRNTGADYVRSKEIMHVTVFFVALFLCMMGYFTVYSLTHEEELMNNSYNNRQQILSEQNRRGSILARDGKVLAETVVDDSGNEKRVYPYENLFAHVVGYVDKGRAGLEAQANYYLIQSSIPTVSKLKRGGSGEKNPGDCVCTTLDVELQEAAGKALGVYRGTIIALDPKTGEILAMVSRPDFDPNRISQDWETILEDEESGTLLNRATQGLYPPGSTFKIITALEYIREHPDSWQKYRYTCSGSLREGEDTINCYHGTRHGAVDLKKSFAKSCNTSFASMGMEFDKAMFSDTLYSLLFNQELPLEGVYNQSRLEILEDDSRGEMMQNAIGQGRTQITPIHLAMITSSVANGGILMKPYMVRQVESADGVVVKTFSSEEYGELMSSEEAAILADYMKEVVENGTGTKLSGLSYTAAGKTGSAEFGTLKGESHAWFTGFAPAEDPGLVVTVIIEGAGSGGDYAVPVARRVFDAYFNED